MVSNPFSDGLTVDVDSDTSGFQSGIEGAMGSLDNFKAAAAGGAVAAGAAGGINKAVQSFASFDKQMTESTAIMGDVGDTMEKEMSQTARDVAETTQFSADQAAESYFYLASAGLDAEQSMRSLGETAEFAQAGQFDMAKATDILTDAQSALGLASDDAAEHQENMGRLSDMLVQANTQANASVEQFGQALTNKLAPAMNNMGIKTEEGVAALSVFADQGLKGRRAGTILTRTFQGMGEKARENSEAFEELGVKVFDAEGNMRSVADITEDFTSAMDGMSAKQKSAALSSLGFNKRTQQGIKLLSGNSDQLRKYEDNLSSAGGTTQEVADNQMESFSAQMGLLEDKINNLFISIGSQLAPEIEALVGAITPALDAFIQFNEATDGMAGAALLVGTLISGLAVAAVALGPAIASVAVAAAPVAAVLAAIAAVAAALWVAWQKNLFGIRDIAKNVFNGIKNFIQTAMPIVRDVIQRVLTFVRQLWDKHGQQIISTVRQFVNSVRQFITILVKRIRQIIQVYIQIYQALWKKFGDNIIAVIKIFINTFIKQIKAFVKILTGIFKVLTGILQGDWKKAWKGIKMIFVNTFKFIINAISGFAKVIVEGIKVLVKAILAPFKWLYEQLIGGSIIPDIINGIKQAFKQFVSVIKGIVKRVAKAILAPYKWLWDKVKSLFPKIMTSIKDAITGAISKIKNAAKSVAQGITNALPSVTDMKNLAMDFMGGIVDGIQNKVDAVGDAAGNVADAISSKLPGSDAEEGPLSNFTGQVDAMGTMPQRALENAAPDVGSAAENVASEASKATDVQADSPSTQGRGGGGMSVQDLVNALSGLTLNLSGSIRVEGDVATTDDLEARLERAGREARNRGVRDS